MNISKYTVFEYLYRDAANFKVGGQLLLSGECCEQNEAKIRGACEAWDFFVAEQVGVPTLYADLYLYSDGPTSDDIAFHAFNRLRPATQEDVASLLSWGSLGDLVERFTSIGFWDCTLSPHGKW